jgi:hypothetical protein
MKTKEEIESCLETCKLLLQGKIESRKHGKDFDTFKVYNTKITELKASIHMLSWVLDKKKVLNIYPSLMPESRRDTVLHGLVFLYVIILVFLLGFAFYILGNTILTQIHE